MSWTSGLYVVLAAAWTAGPVQAQSCNFSIGGLNKSRQVVGPVHAECPGGLHSAPFGNWGASSTFGSKRNGHQFDGWCRNMWFRDNEGNWKLDCRDGWYEWNSCTDVTRYRAPNCYLYNSANCTEQASTTGANVLGTIFGQAASSCPSDTNGDGYCDAGGCRDFQGIWLESSYMSLYELDPAGSDELVQTIYFPSTWIPLTCTPFSCGAAGSEWVDSNRYDSPAWPAIVKAQFAMADNWGVFSDPNRACAVLAQTQPKYNCR
jgi:hypothetical protein